MILPMVLLLSSLGREGFQDSLCLSVHQEAIGVPAHVAAHRVATNDRPNAELVHLTRGKADVLLPSLPLRDSRKQPGEG